MKFPIVIALGMVHTTTMNGKLNGTMDVTMPSGVQQLEKDTCRVLLPCANYGSEQAYLTISFPFATSANAFEFNGSEVGLN